jgi:phosphoglycolate phosphatase
MTDKAALIIHALNQVGEKPDSSAVMVGDTKYDILGAKQAGIPSAGVLYGYGTKEELIKHGADIIIPKTEDIYNCICE